MGAMRGCESNYIYNLKKRSTNICFPTRSLRIFSPSPKRKWNRQFSRKDKWALGT